MPIKAQKNVTFRPMWFQKHRIYGLCEVCATLFTGNKNTLGYQGYCFHIHIYRELYCLTPSASYLRILSTFLYPLSTVIFSPLI